METVQIHQPSAHIVAADLLEIGAIKIDAQKPFTWSSGMKSPVYCDNRKSLSYPEIRNKIRDYLVEAMQQHFPLCDCVAGVATAGIAQGALVADALGLPYIYVRPKPKEHGMGNQIEGAIEEWKHVVLVEDLVSTGGSSLRAVQALATARMHVTGMVSIFTYGLPEARANFEREGVNLVSLSDFPHLIEWATQKNMLPEEALTHMKAWAYAPHEWMP